jgi:hypothetical protein
MKLKILDCALLTLFSGATPLVWAQAPLAGTTKEADCSASGCRSDEGLLFKLETRGKRDPATAGLDEHAGDEKLGPDRRVTIEASGVDGAKTSVPQPGKATASGKFSLQLPNGGIVWATEDPTLGVAELSVSGPSVAAFENGRITRPVQFFLRSNYPGFIQRIELTVYRASDSDPNQYYPVYGDDSSTVRDVDTQGRFYIRVDWDKNQALWGNYATGFTGTQYAQYVRSLYGAALNWRSRQTNPWGEQRSLVRAFASDAQTAPGHSEFIGTGGSLYYLHHTDLLPGSDIVTLEIRNPTTGSVESRTSLVRGTDCTINETQGRILLTKPLAQLTGGNPAITRDTPLTGYEQRLLVDYEWVPTGFDAGNLTAGVRAKQWVGDHVAVGGTVVHEKQGGQDYELRGVDLTLQAGRGTFLKLEHSESESTGVPAFFSSNGGLSFIQTNNTAATAAHREGGASAIEGQANLKEMGWTDRNWSLGGWLAGIDRDITKNLRVGVGYNFTSFSDDLTKFGYKYKGFFLNVVGSY